MTTKHIISGMEKAAQVETPDPPPHEKQTISPAEHWLLVAEKAYSLAQRRGFVGGDPIAEWSEAQREVDATYNSAVPGMLSRTDAEKMSEYVKSEFGGYGLGYLGLDALLTKHREALEQLTEHHRRLLESTTQLASQQTALLQEAVDGAMQSLQSLSQGKISTDVFTKQADLSVRAVENVLSHLKTMMTSVTATSPSDKKGDNDK